MRRSPLIAALAALSVSRAASAAAIISVPITFKAVHTVAGDTGPDLDEIELPVGAAVYHFDDPPLLTVPNPLFEGIRISPSDVGKSWQATLANDPEFAVVAALLTDGTSDDEDLFTGVKSFRLNGALPPSASIYFGGHAEGPLFASLGGVDLAGYDLTAITERLDALTITENVTPDPQFPQFHGRQYEGQVTLTFEGTPLVPEPGFAGIGVIGAGGVLLARRKRRCTGSSRAAH